MKLFELLALVMFDFEWRSLYIFFVLIRQYKEQQIWASIENSQNYNEIIFLSYKITQNI